MNRAVTFQLLALLLLLLAATAGIQAKLMPVFTALMEGLGQAFNPVLRGVMGVDTFGWILAPALLGLAAWAARRSLRGEPAGTSWLAACVLAVACHLIVQSTVLVDLARHLPAAAGKASARR